MSLASARYSIEGYAGTGPSGEVWFGVDARGVRVVLYRHRQEGRGAVARLRTAVERTVELVHTNIVRVYECWIEDARLWFAGEYFHSGSLAVLAEQGMSASDSVRVAAQVAAALEGSHARGFAHGALEPGLIRVAPEGLAKVLGFGLYEGGEEDEDPSVFAHRWEYRAPEMRARTAGTTSADEYSVGRILLQCLRGARADDPVATRGRAVASRAASDSAASRYGSLRDLRGALEDAAR